MWQSPNKVTRASGKRRGSRGGIKHLKRVTAEIKVIPTNGGGEPWVTEARILLNDFSQKGVAIFSSKPLSVGQEVMITLTEPGQIVLKGKVMICQAFDADSHVLTAKSFSHRALIQYAGTAEETAAVKSFVDTTVKTALAA